MPRQGGVVELLLPLCIADGVRWSRYRVVVGGLGMEKAFGIAEQSQADLDVTKGVGRTRSQASLEREQMEGGRHKEARSR